MKKVKKERVGGGGGKINGRAKVFCLVPVLQ